MKLRPSSLGWLAVAVAVTACTSDGGGRVGTGGTGGTSAGGSGGTGGGIGGATGGSAGSGSGGLAGTGSGGIAGTASGGTAGSATGGGAGTATGGSAGTASGGAAGTATGGSAGTASGGSAGTASGGAAGSSSGGSSGADAGSDACVPKTCADQGKSCGALSDGCGNALYCGTCPSPLTCGGGGTANVCACVPGSWHVETVAPSMAGGGTPGIVVVSGLVHVVFYDTSGQDLVHGVRDAGGTWSFDDIDTTGNVGLGASLARDASGGLHVAYLERFAYPNGNLKYAYLAPGASAWTTSTLTAVGSYGGNTGIAVDTLGGVHVSYTACSDYSVDYAFRPPGSSTWTFAQLDQPGNCEFKTAIALDKAGGVHVSYEGDSYHIRHAYQPPGLPWQLETADITASTSEGGESSIAVASDGSVHLSYHAITYSGGPRVLKLGVKPSGGNWAIETPDSSSSWTGRYTSLVLDPNDGDHIAYVDWTNADLRYAARAAGAGTWSKETVDSAAVVDDTAITFDTSGFVHIAYVTFDGSASRLKYAFKCP